MREGQKPITRPNLILMPDSEVRVKDAPKDTPKIHNPKEHIKLLVEELTAHLDLSSDEYDKLLHFFNGSKLLTPEDIAKLIKSIEQLKVENQNAKIIAEQLRSPI